MEFPVSNDIIISALTNGFMQKDANGFYKPSTGFVSLAFIKEMNRFVLTAGTNASDAKFVYLDEYGQNWDLKEKL
mgnify:CR=1 FL=1